MIFLILTILLTSSFFIFFRLFSIFRIHTFHAVVINYLTCVVTGLIFTPGIRVFVKNIFSQSWLLPAMGVGVLFLITFFLMALTVSKVSITASSIANKTSLVIPVCASLFLLKTGDHNLTLINYLGIFIALISIVFSGIKNDLGRIPTSFTTLMLPFLVFLFGGIIDTLINYLNLIFRNVDLFIFFPVAAFFSAAFTGSCIIGYQIITHKATLSIRSISGGILLGVPNFFSIFFLLEALKYYNNNGAFVYPVMNTGIILLTSLAARFIFKEKFSKINYIGIILAIFSLIFIFW